MGVAVVGADVYVFDAPNFTVQPFGPSSSLIKVAPNGAKTVLESGMTGGAPTLWFDSFTNSFMWPDFFQSDPSGWRVYTRPLEAASGSVTPLFSNHVGHPFGFAANADSIFLGNWGDVPPENLRDTVERRPRSDMTQYTTFYHAANIDQPAHPSNMDLDANYLYWAESQTGKIMRRPLSVSWETGTALEMITQVPGNARGIAVDGETIYFSMYGQNDGQPPGRLMRVANQRDLTATPTATLMATIPGVLEDVAVDAKAIYIAGHGSGTLWKMAK